MEEISFTINEIPYKINSTSVPIDTSLNAFIRDYAQLPGTKFMCLEGGCGACIVAIKGQHPITKDEHIWAVNSVNFIFLFNLINCFLIQVYILLLYTNKYI